MGNEKRRAGGEENKKQQSIKILQRGKAGASAEECRILVLWTGTKEGKTDTPWGEMEGEIGEP